MDDWHAEKDLLRRFLRADATAGEARRVVRHLLSGCPRCLEAAREASVLPESPDLYEEVFARAASLRHRSGAAAGRREAPGWARWTELEPLHRPGAVREGESRRAIPYLGPLRPAPGGEPLVQRTEPAEAVDVVRLAILVAERLDPAIGAKRTEPSVHLGPPSATSGASPRTSKARAAPSTRPGRSRRGGVGRARRRVTLLSLESAYMKDIGEFEIAKAALEEALELYRQGWRRPPQGQHAAPNGGRLGHVLPERALSHLQNGPGAPRRSEGAAARPLRPAFDLAWLS